MPAFLSPVASWVRKQPLLRRCARAAVWLIPDRSYTLKVPDVGPLRIRLRRHRYYLWERFGQGDELMLGVFDRLVRPGDVVYDIGANIGVYTRLLPSWFGASRVIAVEPMAENFDLLQENVRLGGLEQVVQTFCGAVSDKDGEEDLQVDDMNSGEAVLSSVSSGQASVGRQEFGLPPKTERVQVWKLDTLVETERLSPPQVIKIDTEGAEVRVLTGGLETIRRHRPRLTIALHGSDKARGTLALLDELGYAAFGFVLEPESRSGGVTYRQIHVADADILENNNIVASMSAEELQDEIRPLVGKPVRPA